MEIKISITAETLEKAQQILCVLHDYETLTEGTGPVTPTQAAATQMQLQEAAAFQQAQQQPAYMPPVQQPQPPQQQPVYPTNAQQWPPQQPQQPAYMQQPQQPAYTQQPQQQPQQPAYMQQPQQPAYMQQPQQPAYMQQPQQPAYMQQPPAGAPTTAPDYTPEQLGRAVAAFADKAQGNREKAMACLKAQGVESITQLTTPALRGAFAVALRQIGAQI